MSGKPIPAEKMPRVIGLGPPWNDTAPRETRTLSWEPEFEAQQRKNALAREGSAADNPSARMVSLNMTGPPALPPTEPYMTHADAIKNRLRQLTHREMREFAAELFSAYERLHPQVEPTVIKAAIPRDVLAEVLDRFAHND